MKQIFIAANYERKEEAKAFAAELEAAELYVKSDWLYEKGAGSKPIEKHYREMAYQDLRDIRDCDIFVRLADDLSAETVPSYLARGARMFEQGVAFGMGKEIYVVGGKQMIYDYMPRVNHVPTKTELISQLCPQVH